ncbi:hypothetical protein [Corynebacterium sp.]|nr:hypothetical protein [Corynebacterium sp.]HKM24720.1 hypothetical protein [Corynebacterium sp.]
MNLLDIHTDVNLPWHYDWAWLLNHIVSGTRDVIAQLSSAF